MLVGSENHSNGAWKCSKVVENANLECFGCVLGSARCKDRKEVGAKPRY
jgi:hypothetical protein